MVRNFFLIIVYVLYTYQCGAWSNDDLLDSVQANNIELMLQILADNVDPNTRSPSHGGWTPLLVAARNGNVVAVEKLLHAGADPNLSETDGWTPLHFAVAGENVDICSKLIEAGADILKANDNGDFPFSVVQTGHNERLKEVFNVALRTNSDRYDHQNSQVNGRTSTRTIYDSLFEAAGHGNVARFKELVRQHQSIDTLDLNRRDSNGFPLLVISAANNHYELVQYLIGLNENEPNSVVDVNIQENDQWNALMFASVMGSVPMVEVLLNGGANTLLTNRHHQCAHEIATDAGKNNVAEKIALVYLKQLIDYSLSDTGRDDVSVPAKLCDVVLRYKINPNGITSRQGINALMLVAARESFEQTSGQLLHSMIESGHADMYSFDQDRGWNVLMYAIASGSVGTVNKFLTLCNFDKTIINFVTKGLNPQTPLSLAQEVKNEDIISLLKQHGAITSIGYIPSKYAKEIIAAVINNDENSLRYYLSDGGDIRFRDDGGFSALIHAASRGNNDFVRLLLKEGSDINAVENDGWGSLMFAGYQGNTALVDILLDSGANPLLVNNAGMSSYELALSNGHRQVAAKISSDAMVVAVQKQDSSLILKLVRFGGNPGATDPSTNRTPLMVLVKDAASGTLSVFQSIETFLNDNGFIDINAVDVEHNSAIHFAVAGQDKSTEDSVVSVVSLLIAHGANINLRNKALKTVGDIARERNLLAVINVIEKFPTASSMKNALNSLRNVKLMSLKDAAIVLSDPSSEHNSMILRGEDEATTGVVTQKEESKETIELRKKNEEMANNLDKIAAKARQEYGQKAKQRASEERAHKQRIIQEEKKKQQEKGMFAKLFGW